TAGVVSFQAVGTCVLDANQPGNASYNPAPQVQQSFTVTNQVFVATEFEGLAFRSADNGATWVAATTQPPGAGSLNAVAANGANFVAVDGFGKAFISADSGVTWVAATTQPPGANTLLRVAANGAHFV